MFRADTCVVALVLIGLGSNQGDSITVVAQAVRRLQCFAAGEFRTSAMWRTSPVDCPPQSEDFINAVVAFEPKPGWTPERMMRSLKRIEHQFGRARTLHGAATAVRNAPRTLDLDLLVFNDEVRSGPELTLPHPRAVERRFVLAPAVQVAPKLVWPGSGRTLTQLLSALDSDEVVIPLTRSG